MEVPKGYFATLHCEKESGNIIATFIDHPNVNTFGTTWEEAEKYAAEALNGSLEVDYERGFVLPPARKPKAKKGEKIVFIPLEPDVMMAYQLRAWREEGHLTQKAMASRLGIPFQSYQRMERPGHANLTIKTLHRVAAALQKKLIVTLE